jgi:hypothetical protein
MPLLFKNEKLREIYRKKLINSNIYPPIHWELPEDIPLTFKYEHDLSKRILSIPIDQRYGLKEMGYIINKLKA